MRSAWFAFVGLTLLPALALQAAAPRDADPIRLPLIFTQSNPVTTITVRGQAVQAIVDISGGDADGALTLSKEVRFTLPVRGHRNRYETALRVRLDPGHSSSPGPGARHSPHHWPR